MMIEQLKNSQIHSKPYDIVFICGVAKSGTSLLTYLFEQEGYFNPASINNKNESAYGLTQRYPPRECTITREINKKILDNIKLRKFDKVYFPSFPVNPFDKPFLEIYDYISSLSFPVILKDPRFPYTLSYWLQVCQTMNIKIKVYFTYRKNAEVKASWEIAPYIKTWLKVNKYSLDNMLVMQEYQKYFCTLLKIPIQTFNFEELKAMLTHYYQSREGNAANRVLKRLVGKEYTKHLFYGLHRMTA